ncbi:MAG TPA: type II secretion system F family protein [Candidatus Saccharimonadales bacterium]
MAKFDYSAVNKQNKTVAGTIEAGSKDIAGEMLAKQGFKPLLIKPHKSGFDPNNIQLRLPGSSKVKSRDLVIFTRQLSTMINAGVPLVRSLATLRSQTNSKKLNTVLEIVTKDVEGGINFADALEKHKDVFNPIYINMVRAGEAGGILDEILKRLALQQEKDASIRKKIKGAMTYPAVLLTITIIAFFALMLVVIPKIGRIITDLSDGRAALPPYTRVMLAFSDFMISYWLIVFGVIVGLTIIVRRFVKTPSGKAALDKLLLKIPVIKTLVIKVAIARFARTFSSLMGAGVSVLDSINVTANALGNKVIEQELRAASKAVMAGKQLSEPLSQSTIFPPIVSQMLSVGEETGQTDTILVKVADFYEEEVDTLVDSLSSIIEPLMIVVMGGMVGLIAASVIGPISSLSQNIQ